jgi:Tol biopolymer transport system component
VQVVSLTLTTPPDQHLTAEREPDPIRITRDGRTFVFLARGKTGPHLLYRRDLADPEPRPIPGTEDAHAPFLAPNGGSAGFFRQERLYRVSLTGGDPVLLADSANWARLGGWSDDGWVYFVSQGRLMRVAERGGRPELLQQPEAEGNRLMYPAPLPGGRGLLFSECTPGCNTISLHAIDLRSHTARKLLDAAGRAWYLPIGLLLYRPAGSAEMAAVSFDLEHLAITGEPVMVLDHVGQTHSASVADAAFDISSTGTAVYLPGEAVALRTLVQHRGDGTESPLIEDRRGFLFPRVSPDGRSLAVEVHSLVHSTVDGDIWIYDLKSGASRRLAGEGHATRPAWSPDGRRVAFTSWVGDSTGVYIQSADGGPATRLRDGGYRINGFRQVSWTPDMRWVIAAASSDSTKLDILALSTDTSQPPRMIRRTAANEVPGPVSHDGRWLSYESDETGRSELYLQSMAGGPSWPVSTDGANDPVWPGGGAELYYLSGQNLVVARLALGGVPRVLSRRTLPWPAIEEPSGNSAHYDLLPNGDVILIRTPASAQDPVVLLNWFEELRQKTRR